MIEWAIGIGLLLVIVLFFGFLFYAVFRLWYWILKSPNPFPGLTGWQTFWIWRFTGRRR